MEFVQKEPYYLAKRKFKLNDNDVEVEYNSLVIKNKQKFQYKNIKPCFGTGPIGEPGWGSMGGMVLLFGAICFCILASLGRHLEIDIIKGVSALILLLSSLTALFCFIMRFIKRKCVYMYKKNDDYLGYIKITNASKEFIEEFKKRVELANQNES